MSTDPIATIPSLLPEIQPISEHIPRDQFHDEAETVFERRSLNATFALEAQESIPHTFPEGGLAAWLVVFGSASLIGMTFGLTSSVGIFQEYWQTHQLKNYPPTTIGWITTTNISITLFLGVQVGPLFDAHGPRALLLSGSAAYITGLLLLAQCTTYWHFLLCFGILCGIAAALIVTVAIAAIAHWFERRRGAANGVAFVGSSIAGIAFPILLRMALEKRGWAWAIRGLAFVVVVFVGIGNLCVRGRLPREKGKKGAINLGCFRDARFIWMTVGIAMFEFVLFGSLGLLPSFMIVKGYGSKTAANAIAVMSGGSALGRYLAGLVSDTIGRYNSINLILTFSLLVTFGLWLPLSVIFSLPLLYIFVFLFGFGSGSVISLAPVCFGQLCKASEYGEYYGTGYSVVSLGTLVCIPIGGALLPDAGPQALVLFFGGILCVSFVSFGMARWASLEYRWAWWVKI